MPEKVGKIYTFPEKIITKWLAILTFVTADFGQYVVEKETKVHGRKTKSK